jgi:hypothetical protein
MNANMAPDSRAMPVLKRLSGIVALDPNANLLPAFFCLAFAIANHSIFRLGSLPWVWPFMLVAAVAATALLCPAIELKIAPTPRISAANVILGIVALAPLIASIVFGWNREFPFHGDQGFQLKQTVYMAFWWLSPVASAPVGILGRALGFESFRALLAHPAQLLVSRALLLAAIVTVCGLLYARNRPLALAVGTALFVIWGLFEHSAYYRYPGAWYLIAMPFVVLGPLSGNIDLGGRIASASSMVFWLFALRPYLLGRWPDIRVLPVAALILWQKDALYYFDSSYIEPWTVVLSLLAVEALVVHGRAAAPLGCLSIGAAAAMKEPLILALPFIWLGGEPWCGTWRERARVTGAAIGAGFPFLLYFASRKSLTAEELSLSGPIDRAVSLHVNLTDLSAYFGEFFRHMAFSFSGTGIVLALIALAVIPLVLWTTPRSRIQVVCLAAGGAAIVLFFALDQVSFESPGEFRFFLYSLPLLAAGIVAAGYYWQPRIAGALGFIALALQLPGAVIAVERSAGPSSDRNFVENYDSPIVFPLKSLLAQARQEGLLGQDTVVLANGMSETVKPVPGINVSFGPVGELYCECTPDRPNVLALWVRYTNLNAGRADQPPNPHQIFGTYPYLDQLWRQQLAARPACLAKLQASCAHVLERTEGGELVAALGIR